MATPVSPPSGQARPPRRPVIVRATNRLTPRTLRVTVAGDLGEWPEPGPAAHLKIFLPQNETTVMRTYTVRRFDRSAGEVDIDFVLHDGAGPAVRWAITAATGDPLELSGRARSTFTADPDARTYLFAGDASAFSAIATCVESLPENVHATVIAAVESQAEETALDSPARLDMRWLHRPDDDAFVAAIEDASAERVWVACEATVMRRIRASLLERLARDCVSTRGYWKRGAVDHPDHDTGETNE